MSPFFRHLRAVTRSLTFCAVTTFFYGLWLAFMPFMLPFEGGSYRWRSFNFRHWAKATAAILNMKITLSGTAPRAPFFLVSNHLSYTDIIAFASQLDIVFVAKSDVASWPLLGLLCRSLGTIFVNRSSRKDVARVNALIGRTLAVGRSVLLFPEGTSTAGDEVLPFHSALLEPGVTAGYPVSFAAIRYQTPAGQPPARSSVCWWGDMTFLPHLYALFQLHSFEAALAFGSHSIRGNDRKTLAIRLWQAVSEEFGSLGKREHVRILGISAGDENDGSPPKSGGDEGLRGQFRGGRTPFAGNNQRPRRPLLG